MDIIRIAILTDIFEIKDSSAVKDESAFTYEFVRAMHESEIATGGIELTLFTRRNSNCGLPTVSIDFTEAGPANSERDAYAVQEALYMQIALSGMFHGYQLIHCFAPVVSPLLLLAAGGIPVIQTIAFNPESPAAFLTRNLAGKKIRQVAIGPYDTKPEINSIPPSVDLQQFYPAAEPAANFIFWAGEETTAAFAIATEISNRLNLPLKTPASGNAAELLRNAKFLLHIPEIHSPCETVWPIRAIASGIPVAGWASAELIRMLKIEGLGFFTEHGNLSHLTEGILNLISRNESSVFRREFALAHFSRRAMTARYRELYNSLLQ